MKSQGISRLIIMSRTAKHAEALADTIGGFPVAWEQLPAALAESDILITATGASAPIVSRTLIAQAMKARKQRPLFIIDIAVPRDVESNAGDLEQVFLYNIDDLQAVVQENISRRATEASRAEGIVSEEVGRFSGWLTYPSVARVDAALAKLRAALAPHAMGVQQTIREHNVPRDWAG